MTKALEKVRYEEIHQWKSKVSVSNLLHDGLHEENIDVHIAGSIIGIVTQKFTSSERKGIVQPKITILAP